MSSSNPSKGKSKFPLDQATLNPIFNTPNLALDTQKDTENDDAQALQGKAVIILDPTANPVKAFGATNPFAANLVDGINSALKSKVGTNADFQVGQGSAIWLYVAASMNYLNSVEGNSTARTPTVYKNILALNAGSTAVWTSAVGKKWRLMGICVTILKATTAAATCVLKMLDVAADTGVGVTINTGAMVAVPGGLILLQGDFKNGILAAATNTALNVDLSSALAAGGVSVQVWGTEE